MFTVRLADINFGIDNKYPYILEQCRDYITDKAPDITLSVTDKEIKDEGVMDGYPMGYLESLAIYRKISEYLISVDGFLMHCALIGVDNKGIAFAARSGVGKTTHIGLWKKCYKVPIINGDKPLIRFIDNVPYAYGTPWSGKEGFNINTSLPLCEIVFLKRSLNNYIKPIKTQVAALKLFSQIYMPKDDNLRLKTVSLMDRLLKSVRVWEAGCNMDDDAAHTVYNGIFKSNL